MVTDPKGMVLGGASRTSASRQTHHPKAIVLMGSKTAARAAAARAGVPVVPGTETALAADATRIAASIEPAELAGATRAAPARRPARRSATRACTSNAAGARGTPGHTTLRADRTNEQADLDARTAATLYPVSSPRGSVADRFATTLRDKSGVKWQVLAFSRTGRR
jgi:hypothetical protein